MAQMLIRQLEEQVVAILREQARARGVSLKQSLRELLTIAAHQHSDVGQRLAALRRQTPARAQDLDVAAREPLRASLITLVSTKNIGVGSSFGPAREILVSPHIRHGGQ